MSEIQGQRVKIKFGTMEGLIGTVLEYDDYHGVWVVEFDNGTRVPYNVGEMEVVSATTDDEQQATIDSLRAENAALAAERDSLRALLQQAGDALAEVSRLRQLDTQVFTVSWIDANEVTTMISGKVRAIELQIDTARTAIEAALAGEQVDGADYENVDADDFDFQPY